MSDPIIYGNLEVGAGVQIRGECTVPGLASIAGDVEGTIHAKEIQVARAGLLKGSSEAVQMDVRGQILGKLVSTGFLMVRESGNVEGEIHYTEVEVEKGGVLAGQLHRSKS